MSLVINHKDQDKLSIVSSTSKETLLFVTISIGLFTIYFFILGWLLPKDSPMSPVALRYAPAVLIILILFLLHSRYKVSAEVDKSKNQILIKEKNKAYTFKISTIRGIKTSTNYNYFWRMYSSKLIFQLDNDDANELSSANLAFWTTAPNVDMHTDIQSEIGKEIAKFIGVPYQDELNPKLLPYP